MFHTDTIAAISTGMTSSGIGIVRISGPDAVEIADKIYDSRNGKKLADMPTHTIHYGYIRDGEEFLDEVLVMLMRGPRSFTAEDTVEINCHGGVYAMNRILELVTRKGARLAEPGEFTKRAFLNGRIDLSQAEAVIDVINAKNEYALKSSVSQLKGSVLKAVREIREKIIYHIAYIESALDDPEHISLDGYPEQLEEQTEQWIEKITSLIASAENGKRMKEGIRTVSVECSSWGRTSYCNGYCWNYQRCAGRADESVWNQSEYYRYRRYPGNRRCSREDWCKKGKDLCKRCRSGYLCGRLLHATG